MVAPVFSNSALVTIGGDYVDVGYTVDQDARVWFVVQDAAELVPTAVQIKAGQNASGVAAAAAFDSIGFKNGGGAYVDRSLGSLLPSTSYDVYAVAENGAAEDSLVEEVALAFSTPAAYDPAPNHPDPWPPADGDPGEGEFGSTLPDAFVESDYSFWFNKLIEKPVARNTGDNTIAISWDVDSLVGETAPTYFVKLFPAGSTPPNNLAEAVTDPDLTGVLAAVPFDAPIPGTVDETGYEIYVTFSSTEHSFATFHVGREASTLDATDPPYVAFDADGTALPSMPAGVNQFVRASDVD